MVFHRSRTLFASYTNGSQRHTHHATVTSVITPPHTHTHTHTLSGDTIRLVAGGSEHRGGVWRRVIDWPPTWQDRRDHRCLLHWRHQQTSQHILHWWVQLITSSVFAIMPSVFCCNVLVIACRPGSIDKCNVCVCVCVYACRVTINLLLDYWLADYCRVLMYIVRL